MIPRIFPVLEHRTSGNLYVGTIRGMTRLIGSDTGGWFASGPSYRGASPVRYVLRGVAKVEFGPMPTPVQVCWIGGAP